MSPNCTYFQRGKCKACQILCPANAIDFEQKDELLQLEVGNVILTTGYQTFDPHRIPQYGYGRLANVFTSVEFERMVNASGPTAGKIVLRDKISEPKQVVIIHCVGSRDENYNEYCSRVCCMYSLKFAHLVHERLPEAEIYNCYIDVRAAGKRYEEFYHRVMKEGTNFIRGQGCRSDGCSPHAGRRRQTHRPGLRYPVRHAAPYSGGYGRPECRHGSLVTTPVKSVSSSVWGVTPITISPNVILSSIQF